MSDEKQEAQPNPRDSMMDSIINDRRARMREDGVDLPEDPPAPAAAAEDIPTDTPAVEEPEAPAAAPAAEDTPADTPADTPGAEPAAEPELHTVTIDGREEQRTLQQLKDTAQIEGAARNRLAQAEEMYRQAREHNERLAQTPVPEPPAEPAEKDEGLDYLDVARKIQFGGEEEAANTIKTLVLEAQKRDTPTGGVAPSYEDVEANVLNKIEWGMAVDEFQDEYEDILKHPMLSNLAYMNAQNLFNHAMAYAQEHNITRPKYIEILTAAGDSVRDMVKEVGTAQAEPEQDPETPSSEPEAQVKVQVSPDRIETKRTTIQPPAARSGPAADTPRPPEKPQSEVQKRRDAISDMAKARGQAAA